MASDHLHIHLHMTSTPGSILLRNIWGGGGGGGGVLCDVIGRKKVWLIVDIGILVFGVLSALTMVDYLTNDAAA